MQITAIAFAALVSQTAAHRFTEETDPCVALCALNQPDCASSQCKDSSDPEYPAVCHAFYWRTECKSTGCKVHKVAGDDTTPVVTCEEALEIVEAAAVAAATIAESIVEVVMAANTTAADDNTTSTTIVDLITEIVNNANISGVSGNVSADAVRQALDEVIGNATLDAVEDADADASAPIADDEDEHEPLVSAGKKSSTVA